MQIILLKPYKPHARKLKVGTEMGVTNEKGLELIEKGIARDVTKEYKRNIVKKREDETVIIEETIKAIREADKAAEVKELAKEIKDKKNN